MEEKKLPMRRRLRFSLLIIVSQILLLALALSWLVHMIIIAISGSTFFVDNNHYTLWAEIIISVIIMVLSSCERRDWVREEARIDAPDICRATAGPACNSAGRILLCSCVQDGSPGQPVITEFIPNSYNS